MLVRKTNGTSEEYDEKKLLNIITKPLKEANVENPRQRAKEIIKKLSIYDEIQCSNIRKQIEEHLKSININAYNAYCDAKGEKDADERFAKKKIKFIKQYAASTNTANATVDDNSNVCNMNIGVMNAEINKAENINVSRRMVMDKLKELYPEFNPKNYLKDLRSHIIYKHDESTFTGAFAPYCVSITLYPFLTDGVKSIGGKSKAPTNVFSYSGMLCNLLFAVAGQFAGAVAVSEILLYFTYFAKKIWGDDFYKHPDRFFQIGKDYGTLLDETHYWASNMEELKSHDFGSDELNAIRDGLIAEADRPLTAEELEENAKNILDNPDYTLQLGDGTRTIAGTIHQLWQQIVYTVNQPAASRGLQSMFLNFSYFDKPFFEGMFGNFYFPDGTQPDWESLKWIQQDFMKWFNAERLHTMLTFPVESCTLLYKDGKFVDDEMFNFVCDEYARGHSFFTYISDSVDSLSSCCRLKNKIQTKEFNFTNGNMGIQTGSKSVITTNLSRIIQDWWNKNYDENVDRNAYVLNDKDYVSLKKYICKILDRVYKYHNAYNELLWDMYDAKLLTVYRAGFIDLNKQYLTIGINGLNQAAEFLGMKCSDNEQYGRFCREIFSTFKEQNELHKVTTGKHKLTFNSEQVPGESLGIKNYNWDKADGYWVPEDTNLYASYVYKPNDNTLSVHEKIRLMGKNYIGDYLDGGSALHANLDHHLTSKQYQHLLTYAAENGCQYLTFNIPNCECDDCGYIAKQPFDVCPVCGSKHISTWDRVIGYLTKVSNWSNGRQIEQKTRVYNDFDKEDCE